MVQAIETRYYGAGNRLGARIIARCEAGRLSHSYDHNLNQERNHRTAAYKLARSLEWWGTWATGCMPKPHTGYAHVWVHNADHRQSTFDESWQLLPEPEPCTT